MTSAALTVVVMGTGCLLGLDRERRELLAFIGRSIDARTHQEFIVPFLCRMTSEALFATQSLVRTAKTKNFEK